MAYRLRPEEPVARGLRRLAAKQLRTARDELRRTTPPSDEGIHEARKSIKKARAILEAIDTDHGKGLAGSRRRLRTVSRTLSGLRDADAMLGVLTKLRNRNPRLFDEHTFARIRHRLSLHKQAARDAVDRAAWKDVDRRLRALRRAAKRWRPRHRRLGALTRAIRLAHRRGRRALARARQRERAADFHEWRKEVKTLWYELRLVERAERRIRRDVATLRQVETWLGDDHNVTVLCEELSKDASVCGGAAGLDRVRLAADRFQCDLRKKALGRARRIYGRKPRAYVRGIKPALKAWRRAQPPRRSRRAAA